MDGDTTSVGSVLAQSDAAADDERDGVGSAVTPGGTGPDPEEGIGPADSVDVARAAMPTKGVHWRS